MIRIFIATGANISHRWVGSPTTLCRAALDCLEARGIQIVAKSHLYFSVPEPPSGQPRYVNGVVSVHTKLCPRRLLYILHEVENKFGRRRGARNAPRTLDLDLLGYGDRTIANQHLVLPHPRMTKRGFVLVPLSEVSGDWKHPISGYTPAQLLDRLDTLPDLRRVI